VLEAVWLKTGSSKHDADHGEADHVLPGAGGDLEILGESPGSLKPGEGPLDDPAFLESDPLALDPLGDVEPALEGAADKLLGSPPSALVGGEGLDGGVLVEGRPEDGGPGGGVMDVGGVDTDAGQVSGGVGADVALAPLDLFSPVDAALVRGAGGLDALRVHDGAAGGPGPARLPSRGGIERVECPLPAAAQAPPAVAVVNGRPRREVVGEQAPLASRPQNVEDGVDDHAGGVGLPRAAGVRALEVAPDKLPLLVRQVAGYIRFLGK